MARIAALLDRAGIESTSDRQRRRHLWCIRVALGSALVSVPLLLLWQGHTVDLRVYRAGGAAWLHDVALYSPEFFRLLDGIHLPFIYPPLAAVLFAPLAVLPLWAGQVLFTAVSVLAVAGTLLIVAFRVYGRRTFAVVLAAGLLAAWPLLQPVRETLFFGQINLVLMLLVVADCLLPRTKWPRGLLLGLAAAIKLTPAVFGVYLLLRKQYKAAAVAGGSFAAFGLAGFVFAPSESVLFWSDKLFSDRVGIGYYANQGVRAVLHRMDLASGTELFAWAGLVIGLLVVTVFAGRRAVQRGDEVTALLLVAVFGLLSSPISWGHHWVWVAVAAVLVPRMLRGTAARTRAVIAAACAVFVVGPLPVWQVQPFWLQQALMSPYTLAGLGFLAVLAVRLTQRRDTRPEPGEQIGVDLIPA